MTYVKKIVMHGFKSFARRTEIPFENSMNVIVGPNGSGKSNITDALCFVLGRLSIKSIRATKAANLLFSGNKAYKGSMEAMVELTFDNSNKTFGIETKEVVIKRTVRKTGQSIYRINGQTKNRQDVLELMAQAGIDPNGFNIVLQGEIQSLVKSTPDERRKIIEEVAGISIYETRKHKSLRELEKTEEKFKEVSAILRERKSYLKNLDKERQEAISYQKLEMSIKQCKSTLLSKTKNIKEKEIIEIEKTIERCNIEIEKIKKQIYEKNFNVDKLQDKILIINKQIQSSTSNEQEVLHREISDLKADLAGLDVRRENFDNRMIQGKEKIINFRSKLEKFNTEISEIQTTSPEIKKQQEQQKTLEKKLDILEQERRKFYILKSNLSTIENKKNIEEKFLMESAKEIQMIEQSITSLFYEIKYTKSIEENEKLKTEVKSEINSTVEKISKLEKEMLEKERRNAILETEITREEKLKTEIVQLKSCPICKQDVTDEHKHKISTTANIKIDSSKSEYEKNKIIQKKMEEGMKRFEESLIALRTKLNELDINQVKLNNSEEKREQIKQITKNQEETREELASTNKKLHLIKSEYEKLKNIEENYGDAKLSLQEMSFADIDVDTEITVKKREINRISAESKSIERDIEESEVELRKIEILITEKDKEAVKKEIEEQKLYQKAQGFFDQRNELQDQQKVLETDIIGMQHTTKNLEDKINNNKIQKAQFNAQVDSLKSELLELGNVDILSLPADQVREKLQKSQFRISRLGNINLRALEVFDKINEQVELIQGKLEIILQEKDKIQNIITEIDKKKKKAFTTTLNAINEYFTRNFSQLSKKGYIFLELEDKKGPLDGGLNILIKASRGKYFDITSLSGGEKTMVALSLIFAIQEYRPYHFYVFDEIDAALDKHNSELLAALIKKYMTSGQYIIITHNDTLISETSSLYGVSMQENISKIISLKV